MMPPMTRALFLIVAALLAGLPTSAGASASAFDLVNGTDAAIADVVIRRAGTSEWKPLAPARSPGARGSVQFSDPDCAFDIRANVNGSGPVTWTGINLCDVKSVTLKKDGSAGAWVDYDQ